MFLAWPRRIQSAPVNDAAAGGCQPPRDHAKFPTSEQDVQPESTMPDVVDVNGLTKVYDSGFEALKGVSLSIHEGELLALLGPNGAGKTTLISAICGLVRPTGGTVRIGGHDIQHDYRAARSLVGLVPQEINLEPFERVIRTVQFSRGLFGKPRDDAHVEHVLRQLSLWDKRDAKVVELSGGMKRRVLIAKALAHEPRVLFLDEPTAGVDVELRREMWDLMRRLQDDGVTIILTTHYIAEAEEMADRVGVIHKGALVVVDETRALMSRLGKKQLTLHLQSPLQEVPAELEPWDVELDSDGCELRLEFRTGEEQSRIPSLLKRIGELGIEFRDLNTRQSSLEEIFVDLVNER